MRSLENLPVEILREIFAYIRSHLDLVTLCSQSRRLYAIAKPELSDRRKYRRVALDDPASISQAYSMLWNILRKPSLGAHVRVIQHKFRSDGCVVVSETPLFRRNNQTLESDEQLLSSFIADIALQNAPKNVLFDRLMLNREPHRLNRCVMRLRDGWFCTCGYAAISEAIEALLLAVCPFVDTLRMKYQSLLLTDLLGLTVNFGEKKYLPNLQHLEILRDAPDCRYDLAEYTPTSFWDNIQFISLLPSIRELTVSGADCYYNPIPLPDPHLSNIRRICVRWSNFESGHFSALIRHCKSLEELEYSSGQLQDSSRSECIVVSRYLGRALLCHTSTLRKLDLDVDPALSQRRGRNEPPDSYDANGPGADNVPESVGDANLDTPGGLNPPVVEPASPIFYGRTIGSLHDFTALKYLSIGVQTLFGHPSGHKLDEPVPFRLIDALPPNLEYLCIRGYEPGKDEKYTSKIEEFIARKDKWPWNLKSVHGIEEYVPGLPTVGENGDFGYDGYDDDIYLPWEPREDDEITIYEDLVDPDDLAVLRVYDE